VTQIGLYNYYVCKTLELILLTDRLATTTALFAAYTLMVVESACTGAGDQGQQQQDTSQSTIAQQKSPSDRQMVLSRVPAPPPHC